MKSTKGLFRFYLALALCLAMFNLIAFLVPFTREGSFWVGYGFTMFAFVLSFGITHYAFRADAPRSRFYGIPMSGVVWIYCIVQIILGLLFMIAYSIPVWISAIICALPLAGCFIGIIAADTAMDHAEKIDSRIRAKTFFIQSLQGEVDGMISKTEDPLARKALREYAEAIRYSDPMSAESLASLEDRLEAKTAELGELVEQRETEAAKALCVQLMQLLAERNRKCKLLK